MRGFRYLFSREFLEGIGLRLQGPGSFRFIVQPIIAIFLGIRDGLSDAKAGRPPFLYDLVHHPENRSRDVGEGWRRLWKPILVATALDAVIQYVIFGTVYVIAAVVVGTFLMGVPYALARAATNRIATGRRLRREAHVSGPTAA